MISDIVEPNLPARPTTPAQLWEEFLTVNATASTPMASDDMGVILDDILSLYLLTTEPEIRSRARAYLESFLPHLDNEQMYYRIASSTKSETDFAAWACHLYVNHPRCTASSLESLLAKSFIPEIQTCLATRLRDIPNCPLTALELIARLRPELLTAPALERKRMLEARREYFRGFLVRVARLEPNGP